MSRSLQYDPALDGLRAIAVSAVVLFHLWPKALPGGWAGVDLFFVLSGYLITRILVREYEAKGDLSLKRFYIRRVLRLMPALVALVVVYLVFALLTDREGVWLNAITALLYLTNWARAFNMADSEIGHTWSLAIEEQFYILWPFILLLFLRRGHALAGAVALLVLAIAWRALLMATGTELDRIYNGFDTHADPLLIGCVLALLPWRPAKCSAALPFGLLLLWFVFAGVKGPLALALGYTIVGLISAWLVLAAAGEGWFRAMLSWRPLVFTGKISYGIYLWHFPIIVVGRHHVPESLSFLLIVLSFAAAVGSFYIVEKPFLRAKDKLASGKSDSEAQPVQSGLAGPVGGPAL